MPTVDFTAWVTPPLELAIAGHTYLVPPPTVEGMKVCHAHRAYLMARLGGTEDVPPQVKELLAQPVTVTLGLDVHAALVEGGIPAGTIGRMGLYAAVFWSAGQALADTVATLLWGTPEQQAAILPARTEPEPSTSPEE